jgi:PIN domain nuclease of toxin-antitoxin system
MRIALDTNAFIWWFTRNPSLGATARALIEDPGNRVSCSAAVVWEIVLKRRAGRLRMDGAISQSIAESGFNLHPIFADDAERSGILPWDHSDPFDRLIVAQALQRGETLLSSDSKILDCGLLSVIDTRA